MAILNIGDKAPDFNFSNEKKETRTLESYKGKKLVLYFYPKDNTSGCTAESCNLRDNYDALKAAGYEVLGVSPDSEKSHTKFKEKHQLPFELLPDTEKQVLEAYGAWGEKKMFGKTYMGVIRTTFIIDENGIIEDIIKKVKTKEHANQILK